MKKNESDCIDEWNKSYSKKQNFVFYPHEEIIRFISKYFCKRIDFNDYSFLYPDEKLIGLDLGCGIGRHVKYLSEMGIKPYGIDLSKTAIDYAKAWFLDIEAEDELSENLTNGSITAMPYEDNFFNLIVSHGVLDSMPFKIAYEGVEETHRCLKKGGLFYFDVISGDDKKRYREYTCEEIVETKHEKGTIQAYYNWTKILELASMGFTIIEAQLLKKESLINNLLISRYHLVFKKD
jgi:SAM-dependent methyltransferase